MIQIYDMVKTYGDFSLRLSFSLPSGKVSGIVGRNGAGKSTAIKAILGLIRPDSGSVITFGKEASQMGRSEKERIGVALSDSGFSSYMSVNDIIGVLKGMYSAFNEADFRSQCSRYSLPFDKRIKDFSTGMNARLRTLIACSHDAKLLILDEPTAGLDVVARREVLDMLRRYLAADSERSMLITSHISSDLEGICDDIYMINDGNIILHEDTDVILGEYAVLRLNDAVYEKIDRRYFIQTKKESFGYSCLTNQKQYYAENWPDIVIESGSIDEMIIMMTEGNK